MAAPAFLFQKNSRLEVFAVSKKPVHWDEDAPEAAPQEAAQHTQGPKLVRVRCISHGRPFTDKKGLDFGEEADVSEEIAEALMARELVELV
jgi:hypothetical protein